MNKELVGSFVLALIVMSSAVATADSIGECKSKGQVFKVFNSVDKARTEMNTSQGLAVTIIDRTKKEVVLLIAGQKKFMKQAYNPTNDITPDKSSIPDMNCTWKETTKLDSKLFEIPEGYVSMF